MFSIILSPLEAARNIVNKFPEAFHCKGRLETFHNIPIAILFNIL